MNDRLKELFSNSILFTIANLGSKILVFLMVPLYTAVLSPAEYGVSDLISTTVSLLYPILTLCMADGVLRYCFIKEFDIKQVFSVGLLTVIIAGIISTIIALFF